MNLGQIKQVFKIAWAQALPQEKQVEKHLNSFAELSILQDLFEFRFSGKIEFLDENSQKRTSKPIAIGSYLNLGQPHSSVALFLPNYS